MILLMKYAHLFIQRKIKMQKKFFFLIFCFCLFQNVQGQELEASVSISTPKLQAVDPIVFKSLETSLQEFLNNQRWTDDEYEEHERIECLFQVNITEELGDNTFRADIAIQSLRPVFGTDYKTPLITHVDRDIVFTFEQFQQIEDSRDIFQDNLSSVFTFYAYWILGMDYDSFSSLGGEEHFRTAQNVINSIPPNVSSSDKGWGSLSRKTTRFWIMENLLSPRVRSFREAMYTYHRQCLDIMHEDSELGVSNLSSALQEIDSVNKGYPNSIVIQIFGNTKADEIIEIYKKGNTFQRSQVFQMMRKIDPANASKYNVLRG